MTWNAPRVLLAGGGTGGHVIPAIAIAKEIASRGGEAHFVGTRERIEAKLVPSSGFPIAFIRVRPLTGGNLAQKVLGFSSVPPAIARSALLVRRLDPDVVLGVGGYVAGPVVLAARLLGRPTALLEQNATVGMTNRLLSRVVSRAFVSYEETIGAFPEGRAVLTGNPVKQSILDAARSKSPSKNEGPVRVLVMGGSQGAHAIDEWVPLAMGEAGLGGEVTVLHQCGQGDEGAVRSAYEKAGIEAEVVSFIEDTAAAYLRADLVVARAGATTVSEITVMGLPAVLLPYPHHEDRQQERNAAPMRQCGAAVVIDEKQSDVGEMSEAIAGLVRDKERRLEGARASASLGRADATRRVADGIFELARSRLWGEK